ncbi:hypothetical protein ABIB10_005675 [Bradyrhizobium sp. RT3b]
MTHLSKLLLSAAALTVVGTTVSIAYTAPPGTLGVGSLSASQSRGGFANPSGPLTAPSRGYSAPSGTLAPSAAPTAGPSHGTVMPSYPAPVAHPPVGALIVPTPNGGVAGAAVFPNRGTLTLQNQMHGNGNQTTTGTYNSPGGSSVSAEVTTGPNPGTGAAVGGSAAFGNGSSAGGSFSSGPNGTAVGVTGSTTFK